MFWPSSYLHPPSPNILPPFFHPCSPLCLCASGRAVLLLWRMWTRVRWLTCVSLEAEIHGACGFSARHDVLGCVLYDTVSNLATPLVRLQEGCDNVASVSVFFVWRLKTSSCPSLTDWLSDFQPVLCSLAKLLSLSPSHRTVWCCATVLHLLELPSSLLQKHFVSRRWCSSACEYLSFFPSLCSSIPSSVPLEPAEVWRCDLCQRLPEFSFFSILTTRLPH